MEALGRLSQLKVLSLDMDAFVGEKLSCESGDAFPQLQELELWDLNCLEEWEMERGAMKVLRKIWITSCERLKKLPECIRYIDTLEKLEALYMSEEFAKRYEGYGGVAKPGVIFDPLKIFTKKKGVIYDDDYKIIQHIPSVKISTILPPWELYALVSSEADSSGTES